jgi:imidazoleglycerol-phosphate dehydratase
VQSEPELSASRAEQGDSSGLRVRVAVSDAAKVSAETGIPVLDHLLELLARYAALDLTLEVEPGQASAEAAAAGSALGEELRPQLRAEGVRGYGSASVPAGEALAHVALEVSDDGLFVSNVDLSEARVGGLAADVIGDFLRSLAAGAGITLHVRLLEGDDPEHVLDAIFKSVGVAVAAAVRRRQATRGAGS